MPGDISKHTKYAANVPYPEPMVEKPDITYANLLLQDYSGAISELTAINLYVYQHIVSDREFNDYAELIGGIAMVEMKHLELIGKTIKMLGVKPVFTNSVCPSRQFWSPCYVNFTVYIKEMLLEDIKSEKKAIDNYKHHISIINDKYIKKLLERIIVDEELHIKLFISLFQKYNSSH